jgi:hypothetical protein
MGVVWMGRGPVHLIAAVAIGLLIGSSIFVAVRLLLLHRRTRALPEFLLGWMLLLSVGVAYPLRIAVDGGIQLFAGALLSASHIAVAVGFSMLFVFTWRVFRPESLWARLFASAGVATELGGALYGCVQVVTRGVVNTMDVAPGEIFFVTVPVMIAYVWTAWESLHYYGAMRRRVKIGLADAAVSERFLLWGLMALSATAGVGVSTVALALRVYVHDPVLLLSTSVIGLCQTVLLLLVFAPPRAYLRWVHARTAASGG